MSSCLSMTVTFIMVSTVVLNSHLVFLTWMLLLSFSSTNSPVSWLMMSTQSFWYGRLFPLNTVMGGVEPWTVNNNNNVSVTVVILCSWLILKVSLIVSLEGQHSRQLVLHRVSLPEAALPICGVM